MGIHAGPVPGLSDAELAAYCIKCGLQYPTRDDFIPPLPEFFVRKWAGLEPIEDGYGRS